MALELTVNHHYNVLPYISNTFATKFKFFIEYGNERRVVERRRKIF